MDNIINLQILRHPVNWLVIFAILLLVWYGAFAVSVSFNTAPLTPNNGTAK